MSDTPLFQNMDEQERLYAPEQVPQDERVRAEERSGIVERNDDLLTDTDAPVPVGNSGFVPAAPVSENFDPGEERERRDLDGDADLIEN